MRLFRKKQPEKLVIEQPADVEPIKKEKDMLDILFWFLFRLFVGAKV